MNGIEEQSFIATDDSRSVKQCDRL